MNDLNTYDLQALRAIRRYHKEHGKPPVQIEATAGFRPGMTRDYFLVPGPPEPVDYAALTSDTAPATKLATTCVPVMPLGSGDIIYKHLVIREIGDSQEQADCTLHEKFHRLGAKLARAGLLIVEPKRTWGLCSYHHSPTYYSRIEAWIFGEEAVLNEMLANQSVEEQ